MWRAVPAYPVRHLCVGVAGRETNSRNKEDSNMGTWEWVARRGCPGMIHGGQSAACWCLLNPTCVNLRPLAPLQLLLHAAIAAARPPAIVGCCRHAWGCVAWGMTARPGLQPPHRPPPSSDHRRNVGSLHAPSSFQLSTNGPCAASHQLRTRNMSLALRMLCLRARRKRRRTESSAAAAARATSGV